jgi:uncharacterized membrane protein (UPF0127 family)
MKKIFSKDNKGYIIIGVILVLLFVIWYGYRCLGEKVCEVEAINKFVRHDVTIQTPNGAIVTEVVDTVASRELGLSGRSDMRDNEGMLFVFDMPGRYGFWMKDMTFSLDIVWINQNGQVVTIERNLSPSSYPETFINAPEASYVLELKAGKAEQLGLFLGSRVSIGQ